MMDTFIDLVKAVMGVGTITDSQLYTPKDGDLGCMTVEGNTKDGKRFTVTLTIKEA